MSKTEQTCRHGRTGFCWDEADAEQREAYTFLYRHAFEWAYGYGADVAEVYAAAFAAENWDDPDEAGSHSHERFMRLTGSAA